ncbi:DUF3592 domain-containing protein [Thiorhodococcus mannitoliphagus]|uniref:DUF3592 domain-containing protein n=1 Tax=Thiorhodococcus mannitoliphagus TaxID=329406 RepID=A0A6P1E2Y2_9GAMM|nr:DUF3592 domain-containing protein [Thiorhodococcus mannitoliphagus]NEX23553.1 DUF3592 domain-containing protein [Thiorhodococcus mannitoliphagus]
MKTKPVARLINALFGLIGIGLLVGAYVSFEHTRDFNARAMRAEGVVQELILSRSGSGTDRSTTYRPRVKFTTADGQRIDFVGKVGSNPPSYRPDERVTVLYLPDNPYRASISGFWQQWFLVVMLCGMGAIFTAVGILPLWAGLRAHKRKVRLLREGRLIQAKFQGVEPSPGRTNRRHAYRIVAHWQDPMTSKLHVFRSEPIWFDPSDYVDRELIDVRIDPQRPSSYYLDISFLPELAS